ncbi:MAG: shikimate kinase [bacterium]|nr:shikimate kinase [bacterium]MDZ4248096.1 shikimate kinase [Patescibacteria group bacterium]
MTKHIFIVGPGSVGKSTTGSLLATKLGYAFRDVDSQFCERIGLIGDYIKEKSYRDYCKKNADLFDTLVAEAGEPTVFALPSGFLVHEKAPEIAESNKKLLKKLGLTILLLPSQTAKEGVDTVVQRHLSRNYIDTDAKIERERFISRFPKYLSYGGNIQIFSVAAPEKIADEMLVRIKEWQSNIKATL